MIMLNFFPVPPGGQSALSIRPFCLIGLIGQQALAQPLPKTPCLHSHYDVFGSDYLLIRCGDLYVITYSLGNTFLGYWTFYKWNWKCSWEFTFCWEGQGTAWNSFSLREVHALESIMVWWCLAGPWKSGGDGVTASEMFDQGR